MKPETKAKIISALEVPTAIAIIGIPIFAAGALLGSCMQRKCEVDMENKSKQTSQDELINKAIGDIDQNSIKTFNEGEHFISIRLNNSSNEDIVNYTINSIPEGYEVYEIFQYEQNGNTEGYDIWFVNNEKVEVHASYNKNNNKYGYYTFGEVIEEEKTLTK